MPTLNMVSVPPLTPNKRQGPTLVTLHEVSCRNVRMGVSLVHRWYVWRGVSLVRCQDVLTLALIIPGALSECAAGLASYETDTRDPHRWGAWTCTQLLVRHSEEQQHPGDDMCGADILSKCSKVCYMLRHQMYSDL